jgi:hypothetical protein
VTGPTRRHFLAGSVVCALTAVATEPGPAGAHPGAHPAADAGIDARARVPAPPIVPRSEWGGDLPAGGLVDEAPGDVRFLLVHHTQTPNSDGPDEIGGRLRSIYHYHRGNKGWPDVAYNFFVDAAGRVWEGRTGSLERPVRGDATGGSQGFAQLCCFVGDHTTAPPTAAAQESMAHLLAHLADRYGIDLCAGPTIVFTSRGSNRWAAGTQVTTDPVAGHRDMSQTACPGDGAYPLIRSALLPRAQQIRAACPAPTTMTAAPANPANPANPADPAAAPSSPVTGSAAASPGVRRPGPGRVEVTQIAAALALGAGVWAVERRHRARPGR